MLCDPDSTLFNVGEVWDWCGTMYLLLRRDVKREWSVTIRADNQQVWIAMDLETGRVQEIRIHTSVLNPGSMAEAQWVML